MDKNFLKVKRADSWGERLVLLLGLAIALLVPRYFYTFTERPGLAISTGGLDSIFCLHG